MVCETFVKSVTTLRNENVLILVLMEDGLRVFSLLSQIIISSVLILVLMEDGLRDLQVFQSQRVTLVS